MPAAHARARAGSHRCPSLPGAYSAPPENRVPAFPRHSPRQNISGDPALPSPAPLRAAADIRDRSCPAPPTATPSGASPSPAARRPRASGRRARSASPDPAPCGCGVAAASHPPSPWPPPARPHNRRGDRWLPAYRRAEYGAPTSDSPRARRQIQPSGSRDRAAPPSTAPAAQNAPASAASSTWFSASRARPVPRPADRPAPRWPHARGAAHWPRRTRLSASKFFRAPPRQRPPCAQKPALPLSVAHL